MKTLRNVLTAVTLFLAIGASVASALSVTVQSRQKVSGDQGNLTPGTCEAISTTLSDCDDSSSKLCDIASGTQYWRYFSNTGCSGVFKKP